MKPFHADALRSLWVDLLLSDVPDSVTIKRINTDTRSLQAGETFVAVSGERFDAHQFVPTAIDKGANAIVVETPQSVDIPQIVVKDTRLALAKLATAVRQAFHGTVIGLTGSVGKTTNKQMLAAIFAQVGKTHATRGNLNNDLGVPFTWFDLPNDAQFAVIEMGANHQGEIAYLSHITRPDIAMITNAGAAHLEGFGGLDGVAKGKGELFSALTSGNVAVMNQDDKYAQYWRSLIADGVMVSTFSLNDSTADVFATAITADGSAFDLCHAEQRVRVTLPTVGQHNVMNAVGCAACALAAGIDLATIAKGLAQFETAQGRLQKHTRGSLTVIDDTYNANPMSMTASAEILSASSDYRIMVVGDMGELGETARDLHAELGQQLSGKADAFLCLGEHMTAFVEQNPDAEHFADKETLCQALQARINEQQTVTVLVKGSRAMQMEHVVEYLQSEKK